MYWCHILKNNGQRVTSAPSKYSAWTVRVFFKYLSPSAFKIGSCYKVSLLCWHSSLSVVSMNGLSLVPECSQMLRECLDEWQWGRDTGRTKPCILEFKHASQIVPRKDVEPESWDCKSGQKLWAETANASLFRLRILEQFRPTALWSHGCRLGFNMYGLVLNDELQTAIYYCCFIHTVSGFLIKVWFLSLFSFLKSG